MKKNYIVAITGGIGCGKSSVLEILRGQNYPVLSCDELVNLLYKKKQFLKSLKDIFPNAISGKFILKVDKSIIANEIFSNQRKKQELENLIHPYVLMEALSKCEKFKGLVFVEVPILFERDYQNRFDNVVIVQRKVSDRIRSVKIRSNLTNAQVLDRIKAQIDYDKYDFSKYIVIDNNGSIDDLKGNVNQMIKALKAKISF